jgi:hypothetical protein
MRDSALKEDCLFLPNGNNDNNTGYIDRRCDKRDKKADVR